VIFINSGELQIDNFILSPHKSGKILIALFWEDGDADNLNELLRSDLHKQECLGSIWTSALRYL